ncbi:MAG TPA: hypothetical protein VFU97_15495 [Xanthobacteraceae bacterium]|jgi:hypothetical protein|nr:hypothetical protein [Xanthobacteraceae bacterium]
MIREQMINFLQTVVVFLLLTNALSVVAATWAIRVATGSARNKGAITAVAERMIGALLGRA